MSSLRLRVFPSSGRCAGDHMWHGATAGVVNDPSQPRRLAWASIGFGIVGPVLTARPLRPVFI